MNLPARESLDDDRTSSDQPTRPLDGCVGIVTGGGRGIGAAVSRYAATLGASVVVSDYGASPGGQHTDDGVSVSAEVANDIVAAGGVALADSGDVRSFADAEQMVEAARSTFGRLDFVVHCAGILRDTIFHKMTPTDFETVLGVHLLGGFNVARAAAPIFREQLSGSYVFMSSTSGLIGAVGQANYSAAKAGLVGLSRSVAIDMHRFGVRSNIVAPFAATRMTASLGADGAEVSDRVRRLMSIGADTVAPIVAFLCAEDSQEITGQVFVVRNHEVFLMSQARPVRGFHHSDGWDMSTLTGVLKPAVKPFLYPLETSADYFSWDPI